MALPSIPVLGSANIHAMATTRPDGQVTIADVAQRAGVSQMTVSRVINSSAAVRPDKRARVERAIEELGYVPNRLARGLSARRLGVIAVLVPDLTNPFFTEIVHKIEDVANEQGLTVVLGNSDERPEREADFLRTVAALRVDGAIIGATGMVRSRACGGSRTQGSRWSRSTAASESWTSTSCSVRPPSPRSCSRST